MSGFFGELISQGVNYLLARKNQNDLLDREQQFASDSANIAFQRQKELLDYNSPAYQVQRLRDAGLNPALAYSGEVPSIPSVNSADNPTTSPIKPDFSVMDAKLKEAQIRRLDTAADNESQLTDAEVKSLFKGLEVKDEEISQLRASVEVMTSQVQEIQQRITNMSTENRQKLLDVWFKQDTYGERLRLIQNDLKVSDSRAKNIDAYFAASILGLQSQAQNYLASANLSYKQSAIAQQLARIYSNNAWLSDQQRIGLSVDPKLANKQVISSLPSMAAFNSYNSTFYGNLTQMKRYGLLSISHDLLSRFGSDQQVMQLILGYSRAFESAAGGVSDLLNSFNPLKLKD